MRMSEDCHTCDPTGPRARRCVNSAYLGFAHRHDLCLRESRTTGDGGDAFKRHIALGEFGKGSSLAHRRFLGSLNRMEDPRHPACVGNDGITQANHS